MSNRLDATGLSCPQPVLLAMNKIKEMQYGEMMIQVDTDTSKENVSRAAQSQGWEVTDVQENDTGYQITIKKDA
jgi:TusA-related sulfurtransferase